MLLQRLLQEISGTSVTSLSQLQELSEIHPSRFYVENVRSLFGVKTSTAKRYCDMAVKNGLVRQKVGVECPNEGRIIASFYDEKEIPEQIVCSLCEANGEEVFEFQTKNCKKIYFYEFIR